MCQGTATFTNPRNLPAAGRPSDDLAARAARRMLARAVLVKVAAALGRARVQVAPLKGVLLHAVAPVATRDRPLIDVDVLVAPGNLERALAALEALEFREIARSPAAVTLEEADHDVSLDLHFRVFPPYLFRLSARDILHRGQVDVATFGVPVVLPSGLDVYAHLVGHFAKGRHTRRDVTRTADFGIVAQAYGLGARECSRHLQDCGLARAAEYALGEALAVREDPFARSVLALLPRDPLRPPLAAATRALLMRPTRMRRVSALAPYLVASSLGWALSGAAAHAARGAVRRLSGTGRRF